MNQFEKVSFLPSKYLLLMLVGEKKTLPIGICSYGSLKSTASQLKKNGKGVWIVRKNLGAGCLNIERTK